MARYVIGHATTTSGRTCVRCIVEARGLRARAYARSLGGAVATATLRLANRLRAILAHRRKGGA